MVTRLLSCKLWSQWAAAIAQWVRLPRVRIPCTTSTLISIKVWILCEKDENKPIRGRDRPIWKITTTVLLYDWPNGFEPMIDYKWSWPLLDYVNVWTVWCRIRKKVPMSIFSIRYSFRLLNRFLIFHNFGPCFGFSCFNRLGRLLPQKICLFKSQFAIVFSLTLFSSNSIAYAVEKRNLFHLNTLF